MTEIKLTTIPLEEKDLLFYESFVNDTLGGKEKARIALLDIIDRYFCAEFIDWELLEEEE